MGSKNGRLVVAVGLMVAVLAGLTVRVGFEVDAFSKDLAPAGSLYHPPLDALESLPIPDDEKSPEARRSRASSDLAPLPARQQRSLWEAFSEARRGIVGLTPREAAMKTNGGVRFFAQNPAQRLTARFLANAVRIESGRPGSKWRALFTAPHLPEADSVRKTGTRVEYQRGTVVEWYENRTDGLEHGFILNEPLSNQSEVRIAVGITGLAAGRDPMDPGSLTLRDDFGRARLSYQKLLAWDAGGRLVPSRMAPRPGGIDLVIETGGSRYPITIDPLIVSLERKLGPEVTGEGQEDDRFGNTVALFGDTALIGASESNTAVGSLSGAAYVFTRSGNAWIQEATLLGMTTGPNSRFGSAVALDGETALVGAYNRRTAYVFVREEGQWRQQAQLDPSNPTAFNMFGEAVSLSGNHALVGADGHRGAASGTGIAYLYRRTGESWNEEAVLEPDDLEEFSFFGSSVSIDGETAVVGATRAPHGGNQTGAAYVYARVGTDWILQQKLVPDDAAHWDHFGISVALSGDQLLAGSYYDDDLGEDSGSAYLFQRDGADWTQAAKLTASDGARLDRFGISVSLDGELALIGAPWTHLGRAGGAYVFEGAGSRWSERAKLLGSEAGPVSYLGISVSLSGENALVGAGDSFSALNGIQGSAYIFDQLGPQWRETAKLALTGDSAAGDRFGGAISVNGDSAVIGAAMDNTPAGASAGSVYVLVREGESWSPQARLAADDASAHDEFGNSVSLDGETVLIGAFHDDIGGESASGSAYVFTRDQTGWSQEAKLVPADIETLDFFGCSVSLDGDLALIGSYWDRARRGSAYVFVREGRTWRQEIELFDPEGGSEDNFGLSVSLSGTTAMVGAPGTDVLGSQSGSVFVYDRSRQGQWLQQAELTASDGVTLDYFGSAVSLSGDQAVAGAPGRTTGGLTPGSAYVFTRTGRTWTQEEKLVASDGIIENDFGAAVSIQGDLIVIGAPGDGVRNFGSLHESGSAYLFKRAAPGWTEKRKLVSPTQGFLYRYGSALAQDGETLMIAASRENGTTLSGSPAEQQGRVYVYRLEEVNGPPSLGEINLQVANRDSTGIDLAKLLRHASDPEGDPVEILGVEATTIENGSASLENGILSYDPPPGFVGTDRLTLTLSDGVSTEQVTISLTVTASSAFPSNNRARFAMLPNGSLRVSFHGVPGLPYGVERSVDMIGWIQIAVATATPTGRLVIEDADPPVPTAIYRLVYPAR